MRKKQFILSLTMGFMLFGLPTQAATWEVTEAKVEDGYYRICNDRYGDGSSKNGEGVVVIRDLSSIAATYAGHKALIMKEAATIATGDKDWESVWHIWSDGKGNYHIKNCGSQAETYVYPMYTVAGQSDYIFALGKEREDLCKVRFYTKDWGSKKSGDRNVAMNRQDTARAGYVFIRPTCSLWRWRIGGSALVKLNGYSSCNPQAEWKLEPVDVTGYEDWLALNELISDVDGSYYEVGENPGKVSSAVVLNTLTTVLEEARNLSDNGGTETQYKEMIANLKKAKAEVDKNIVPLTEGYYFFANNKNKTAIVPYNDFATRKKSVATNLNQSSEVTRKVSPSWVSEAWFLGWDDCDKDETTADQQFIWKLTKASDSTFYMKNCAEESYIKDSVYFDPLLHSKSRAEDAMGVIPMHGTARSGVEFKNLVGNTFELFADNNWLHFSHGDNHFVTTSTTYTTTFAAWKVCKVPDSRITAKFKLNDAITDAGGILVDWIPGNNPGQLKMSVAQPLIDALTKARNVYANETATDADYLAAESDLRKVFDATKEQLKDTVGVQNALVDGFYYIVSAERKFQQATKNPDNIPYCYGGDDGSMHWSVDQSLRNNLDHVFQIKKLASGNYSVQCIGTGQYIGGSDSLEILPMTNDLEVEQIFTLHPKFYYKSGSCYYWLDMYSTRAWWSISSTQKANLPYQLKSWNNGKETTGLMQPFNYPGASYYKVIAVTDSSILAQVDEVLKEKTLMAKLNSAIEDAKMSLIPIVSYDVQTDNPLIYEADPTDPEHNQFDSNAQQIGYAASSYANLIDGDKTTYWLSRTGTSYGPYLTEHPYLQVDLRDKPQRYIRFKYGVAGNTNELYGPLGERPITYGVTDNGQRRRPLEMKVYATNDTTSTWTPINTYTLITDPNIREYYSPAIVMDQEYRFVRFYCYDNYAHATNRGWGVMQPGEFQVYPAVYNAANSMVEYDADVKTAAKAVETLLSEAETQATAQKTTEAFVDNFEAAISTLKEATIDTMPLVSRIYEAQTLYDSSYVSSGDFKYGDVTSEQKAEFAAAIAAAKSAVNINIHPTKASLSDAYAKLDAAYKKLNGERKTFEVGKWYYIVSTAKQGYHVESNPEWRGNHAVYASGNNAQKPLAVGQIAPTVEPLRWGHYVGFNGDTGLDYPKNLGADTDYNGGSLDCESNAYAQWRIVQVEDSVYAIQNRATGFYMGRIQDYTVNTGNNGITQTVNPMKVRINIVGRNQFEIIADDSTNLYYRSVADAALDNRDNGNGLPLHSCAADFRLQWWGTGTERGYNTASSYTFVPVDDESAEVEYHGYNNNVQIMTLPFAVDFGDDGILTTASEATTYAVKNVSVNRTDSTTKIELTKKSKFEAGEPFILVTGDPNLYSGLAADSIQMYFVPNNNFVTSGKTANGLVGMLNGDSIQAFNMGMFEKAVLQVMPDNNVFINGQTGYLNPTLTKDLGGTTDYTINGNGIVDAINSIVVDKNTTSGKVYSIDGKTVGKDNLNGLSKGIYIIGKKKVLVK